MDCLPDKIAEILHIPRTDIAMWEVRRKSIDSRKKPDIRLVYTVEFAVDRKLRIRKNANLTKVDEEAEAAAVRPPEHGTDRMRHRPVIAGAGPAGLFAALELAREGYRPIVIERGPAMEERIEAVARFRTDHVLDPEANMLFGEGGAGTFSDGKLATGIKDSLIREVLREFRDAGAGDDIMYLAKPHIGTDVLRKVIVNIRRKIERLGGEIRFNTRMISFAAENGRLRSITVSGPDPGTGKYGQYHIMADEMILAVGHSARDTFEMLACKGIRMEQKPFSIGVRIEHPQKMIDASQYGEENAGRLPPADYKLSYRASNGRGVYSFCMCPGGEVVVCSTRQGELCVNGMSNRNRDSGIANSGILCDVRTEDFGSDDVLAGVRFQEKYEKLAFANGGGDYNPPRCTMGEFLGNHTGRGLNSETGNPVNFAANSVSYQSDAERVIGSLPEFAAEAIREAIPDFAGKIRGYDDPDAVVTAVETRSSSPVRILRDGHGVSSIRGINPAGEGAGYAGGITSAACDGIRAARHIIERYSSE